MTRLVAKLTVLIAATVMVLPASADDTQIASQIVAKLNQQKQAANLKGFDLGVQVDKGTVTMMGQVASSEQAMLALDVARRIPGVKLVVNDLYVNQQSKPAPAIQPAAARQPVQQQVRPAVAQQPIQMPQTVAQQQQMRSVLSPYNATGAVGSAVNQAAAYAQPRAPQRPVPFAQSQITQRVAHNTVAPANFIDDGGLGGVVGGQAIVGGGAGMAGGGMGGGYGGAIGDNPSVPGYAWPSYAAAPNYGAVSYPQQYSATAWPYIGPFYPYPQVPLGWRKVSLEWDDGWWFLDFTKK